MVFDFIEKTARSTVNVAVDTFEMALGGDGPSREDVANLVAAGLTVAAVAELFGIAEDAVQAVLEQDGGAS